MDNIIITAKKGEYNKKKYTGNWEEIECAERVIDILNNIFARYNNAILVEIETGLIPVDPETRENKKANCGKLLAEIHCAWCGGGTYMVFEKKEVIIEEKTPTIIGNPTYKMNAKKAKEFDDIYNDGGYGYNPYR